MFVCRCLERWAGEECSEPVGDGMNPCRQWCDHGGVCVLETAISAPTCRCLQGWTGARCQARSSCFDFCLNGASCHEPADPDFKPSCL